MEQPNVGTESDPQEAAAPGTNTSSCEQETLQIGRVKISPLSRSGAANAELKTDPISKLQSENSPCYHCFPATQILVNK